MPGEAMKVLPMAVWNASFVALLLITGTGQTSYSFLRVAEPNHCALYSRPSEPRVKRIGALFGQEEHHGCRRRKVEPELVVAVAGGPAERGVGRVRPNSAAYHITRADHRVGRVRPGQRRGRGLQGLWGCPRRPAGLGLATRGRPCRHRRRSGHPALAGPQRPVRALPGRHLGSDHRDRQHRARHCRPRGATARLAGGAGRHRLGAVRHCDVRLAARGPAHPRLPGGHLRDRLRRHRLRDRVPPAQPPRADHHDARAAWTGPVLLAERPASHAVNAMACPGHSGSGRRSPEAVTRQVVTEHPAKMGFPGTGFADASKQMLYIREGPLTMDAHANTSKKADDMKSGPTKGADSTAKPDVMAPTRAAEAAAAQMVRTGADAAIGMTQTAADATQHAAAVGRTQAKQAIEEASRISAACAEANVRTARELTQQSIETGRKLFDAWAAGTEAAIRSSFDLQNALLLPGLSYFEGCNSASEAGTRASRDAVEQWSETVHSTQRATLEAWQATIRATKNYSKLTE